jgi:transposase InsO family protein
MPTAAASIPAKPLPNFSTALRPLPACSCRATPNALAESSWSTLKTELLPRGTCFANLEEARLELAEYLDHYYNTQRLHSTLGYCTPLKTEFHYRFNLP